MGLSKSTNRTFSKIDASGTDPNRYTDSYLKVETPYYNKSSGKNQSFIPGLEVNVGKWERIAMVVAGSYLVYRALSATKKNIPETIAGGTMLMRGISGYCPAYAMINGSTKGKSSNVNIRTSLTINRPVYDVYEYWRNLENLPKFMAHLDKVEELDNITSEWRAKGPAGIGTISWKAQILMDVENQMLSWQSLPGSTINNAGKVVFKETGPETTQLDITISYHAPLGKAGEVAAKLVNPLFENIVKDDIQSFKKIIEQKETSRV